MREFKELADEGKHTFLFVYGAGHGLFDKTQLLVLNSATSGNLYAIEDICRSFAGNITKHFCTVFAVYDMCRESANLYPNLSKKAITKPK